MNAGFRDAFMRRIENVQQQGFTFTYTLNCSHVVVCELDYNKGHTMYCSACEAASPKPLERAQRLTVATGLLNTAALMAGQGNAAGAIDKARGAIMQLKLLSGGDTGQRAAGNQQRPTEWIERPKRRRDDYE